MNIRVLLALSLALILCGIFWVTKQSQDAVEADYQKSTIYVQENRDLEPSRKSQKLKDRSAEDIVIFDEFGDKVVMSPASESQRVLLKNLSKERERNGFFHRIENIPVQESDIFKNDQPMSPPDFAERTVTTWHEGVKAMSDSQLIGAIGISEPKFIYDGTSHIFFSYSEEFQRGLLVDKKTGRVSA